MSVKNTLDGSFPVASGSGIVNSQLTYPYFTNTLIPTIYTIIGNKCLLYLPSITTTTTSATSEPIVILVPAQITPAVSQTIHGFSVNDDDGTQNSMLQLTAGSIAMYLGKESTDGNPGAYNFSSQNVAITRYQYILYDINE